MRKKIVHIQGFPAVPVIVGEKSVIFHGDGYLRTGIVLSVYHSPMGAYLVAAKDAVYWVTPGGLSPAQCAVNACCA